jgi:alpha-L-fucosidase 2
MDIMIIREIYSYALSALEILKTDQALRATIINKRDSLPPIQVSDNGTIQEWIKDYREAEPGHRHISHLLALHPGTRITEEDSILFHAARETIEHRLSHGGGHTGWSRAWIINFYARLLDGDEAYHHLNLLLQKSTLKNLFDTHPPFQIDGNFGGTAGIAEMLLQSHRDFIHLLPALPAAWDKGQITGLKARGNYTIDMSWEEGVLISATIQAAYDGRCRLKYNGKLTEFDCKQGKTYQLNDDFVF